MGGLLVLARWTRANGTTDQCTHATKNGARAETANMELTDPCHPRTCKCLTPVIRELGSPRHQSPTNLEVLDPVTTDLGILKTNMTFQWLVVAFLWLL